VNWNRNAERMRPVVFAAAILFLCVPAYKASCQRKAPPPRARFAQQRPANRQQRQLRGQQPYSDGFRQAPAYSGGNPARPGLNQGYQAPARSGYPGVNPPGHLADWLNQHRNLSAQDQERLLRNSPAFNRLDPETQQRLVQRLHNLNQMPEAQKDRRIARAEMLERMSPQEQMQVRQAGRRLQALPPDRQIMVKRAFQDLRSVPYDQRDTVLNSARYQNQFSPDERDILGNLLRAEPYEAPH